MPDRLPWRELLRRRNGLPAALDTIARGVGAALSATKDDYALSPEPVAGGTINAEQYAALRAAGHQDGEVATAAAVRAALRGPTAALVTVDEAAEYAATGILRCPHTDLPTTMCHHCKETSHADTH